MSTLKSITIFCLGISVLLNSCADSSKHEKIKFEFNPISQANYFYTISNAVSTEVEVNGERLKTQKTVKIELISETTKDSTGNHCIKLTYGNFHIVMKNNDGEEEIFDTDDENTTEDQISKLLKTIKGSTLLATLNKKGEFLKIEGAKEINEKVVANLSTYDIKEKKQVQNLLTPLLGEDFVKNNIQSGNSLFPDTAITIGNSWFLKNLKSEEIPFEASTKYTLNSIKGSVAEITSLTTITDVKSSAFDLTGKGTEIAFSGKQEGSFKIDMKIGVLQEGEINTNLKGVVTILNKELPIIIKSKKKIASRKM